MSFIELAIANVIVHGYPCQEHLAFYVNDLGSQQLTTVQLETVHTTDDIVQRRDVCFIESITFFFEDGSFEILSFV